MRKYLILFTLLLSLSSNAQMTLEWTLFTGTGYDIDEDGAFVNPEYPEALKAWDGKEVLIIGYIVPVDVQLKTYVLSQFPLQQCFFCGNAGPETVIQLFFDSSPPHLLTDQYVILKGKLVLGQAKPGSFFFTLYNTELAG
ncbi:hypothetical protein [Phaeocystidibacter luteus]|uniref:DUF3299 domain-containing protein n=1 Tax=Phaeocystidibacter luteus TaxID=911197 RepID=A0A6N6RLK4_9FLAO|nr:hypothetical protein [Phaeocystidibacter luteus]KAB2814454.1 hypothetical protein F8C67_01585 [Phaeocystidibacter luteus]